MVKQDAVLKPKGNQLQSERRAGAAAKRQGDGLYGGLFGKRVWGECVCYRGGLWAWESIHKQLRISTKNYSNGVKFESDKGDKKVNKQDFNEGFLGFLDASLTPFHGAKYGWNV